MNSKQTAFAENKVTYAESNARIEIWPKLNEDSIVFGKKMKESVSRMRGFQKVDEKVKWTMNKPVSGNKIMQRGI